MENTPIFGAEGTDEGTIDAFVGPFLGGLEMVVDLFDEFTCRYGPTCWHRLV